MLLVPQSPSVVDYINYRDEDNKIRMHIPATIAEADAHVVGGVFHESSADPQSYVDPSYFEFVKFAQMLIDAGDNASDSNFCLSIIEQTTASNRGGHFRAWVRDRPQSAELEALVKANDARAVVHKVRTPLHARAHTPVTCVLHSNT